MGGGKATRNTNGTRSRLPRILGSGAAYAALRFLRGPGQSGTAPAGPGEAAPSGQSDPMKQHHKDMHAMRMRTLWVHYLVIGLGAWLITSPFQFGLFNPEAVATVRDITAERNLWDPALRNTILGWNDIVCGLALMGLGAVTLSERHKRWQWATCAVGLWLMFAPILFWTPSPAVYANDTAVGALAIALSVLIPMMPGMSHKGMMDESTIPPGWSYNPSTWTQRLPIIMLGFFGFLIARYLAAYQFGHIDTVWDPIFEGREDLNGTEDIISSYVSHAFPISDAAFGGYAYTLETLMGCMGSAKRWRTMPWMVTFFFIFVVPLGTVSIGFIMIQPIMIGTYCTLCLVQALAMLIMIPFAVDEVVAMSQYMRRSVKAGRPFWRTFFQGGPDEGARSDEGAGFDAPVPKQIRAAATGITLPWTLLASCAVGVWLMFSRLIFDTSGALADSDHLLGALIITIAVTAMAEVARPLRFLNILCGAWLIASPWIMAEGLATTGAWNSIMTGLVAAALVLPRGTRSKESYGSWDSWII